MCLLCSSWSITAPEDYLQNGRIEVRADKGMARPAKRLVRQTIRKIDEITGVEIDFGFSHDILAQADADILIYGTDEWTGEQAQHNETAAGLAFIKDGVSHATWLDRYVIGEERVYGKRGRLKKIKPKFVGERAKYIVGHEILHTFGLSHPNDDGFAPGFDTDSTVMSYSFTGQYNGLGPLDEAALVDLWGAA